MWMYFRLRQHNERMVSLEVSHLRHSVGRYVKPETINTSHYLSTLAAMFMIYGNSHNRNITCIQAYTDTIKQVLN